MIRCKFMCTAKTERTWAADPDKLYEFEFQAVHSGSPENEQFFAWTPAGTIKTGTVRRDAFEVGKEYYVDFSDATVKPAPAPTEQSSPTS